MVLASLLAIATAMLGLPALATSAAAASENPYASSTITKTYDGTGQGTPDGTFINSENGYSPGDNGPDDGVVASNDYVGYQVETRFSAGPERTVTVSFDVPEYLRLDAAMNPGICQSNSFVTGSPIGNPITGCSYKVKRGVGVTVQHNLIATALDTAGTAQYDQVLTVSTGLQGQEPYSSNAAEAVIVVSAPTADLVLRPSTCRVSGACSSITSSTTTGSLIVMVDALKWPGYNTTKGASVLGEWTAQLDVSDFPAGTTWKVGGVALTATNGILNLGPYVGQQTVNFAAPANWGGEEFAEGETRSFDAHLIVPDTAFETDSYLNNGTGWEPGQDEPSGFNTLNDRGTGARKGYLYPNNDWTRINVYKPVPVTGKIFSKNEQRPWEGSQTLWEDGNKLFSEGTSVYVSSSAPSTKYKYWDMVPGTELLSEVFALTQNITGPSTNGLVISDEWDTAYVEADTSRDAYVTGPDGSRITSGFTIQWSTTVKGEAIIGQPLSNAGWINAKQPVAGATSVRIIFDSLPSGTAEGAGRYSLFVPTKVKSDLAEPGIPQVTTDSMRGWCENCTGGGAVVVPVSIVTMGTPQLGVTVKSDTQVIPGDTGRVSYTVTPTVDDLLSSTDVLNGTLTLTLDACINEYSLPAGSPWELVSEDMSLSCGDTGTNTVVVKLKSDWNPSLSMKDGKTTLPKLVVDTVWSKLTENNGSLSAEWALTSIDGVQSAKVPDVVPVTGSATVTVSPISVVGQQITTSTPKVEIDEVLKYQAVVEAAIAGQESVSANSTVVVMPGRGNDAAYRAQFTEYFDGPESSDFHGTYVVSKVSIVTKDSVAGTTVQCTTNANPSLDPSVNTWGSCTGSTLANATAVKINQPGGNHQGISVVDIDLTPSGNERDDNYLMWIGGVTGAGINAALSLPANDEVVASDINGYVYWDIWGRGTDRNSDSPGIEGVTVELLNSSGTVVATATTASDGFYEFIGYHSGDYTTRLPALGATGGVPTTVPSAFYPDKTIDVEQTYSYAGQRLDNSKLTSTKIALGIDALVPNVNFGFYAPDPYSDLMKSATQVRCTDDSVVCDVTWDVTVKNGGTPFEPGDILGSIGDSPNGTGGSAIWTSDGYYIVKSNGDATKATGLSGTVLGATGANPRVSSSAVWTTDGYYLVNGTGDATKATGLSGAILGAIGKSPTSTGSGVWTSDGYYVVNSSGVATNTGISGTILGATGNEPTRAGYGSAVWTTDGYYLVNSSGTVTEVVEATGLSGTVLGATGDSPVYSSGSAVWTTDGYYVVKNTGVATKATGISGTILGATGTSPVTNSSAVWTTDGYYLVNISGVATEVTGVSGTILGATGSIPRNSTGSAVWTTDGYYVVKNTGVATKATGISGTILGATGTNPASSTGGSAIWTSDGYYIVNGSGVATKATGLSDTVRGATGTSPVTGNGSAVWTSDKFYVVQSNGIATEADIPFPKAPEFTGSPITLTGGKLTDSTSDAVYNLEAIIGERILGATGNSPVNSGSAVWTTDGYYIVNGSGVATKATGISGAVLGAIGSQPTSSTGGSAVWTTDGYYVVKNTGVATEATGISGTVLGATGAGPASTGGSAVWTTDGYYVVKNTGVATEATGISGTVLGATGANPTSGGSGVWTTDGYYIVKNTGVATKATGISGTVLGATGVSPTSGSGVWTTDGYYIVKNTGVATKATGISGAVLGATGYGPAISTGGSGVWTTDGYYVVKNTGVATKATGISGTVLGAIGSQPAGGSGGSGVWTTDGYYVVNGSGVATKATGISGTVLGATGVSPMSSSYGSAVWTSDGYYVIGFGAAIKATAISGAILGATGTDPASGSNGSGVWTTDGYYVVDALASVIKTDIAQNRVNLPALTQSPGGDFITREYQLPNLDPGEKITVTLTGKVNKPNFEASGGKGIVIGNQAWEVFTQTQRPAPSLPSPNLPTWDPDDPLAYGKWTGSSTCTATENWVVPGDQCDQVYASVPTTDQELGALSGYLWFDQNDDGIMQPGEPRLVGQKVVLYQGTNGEFANKRGETFTDENGFYDFTSLVPSTALEADGYYVSFELAANPMLSTGDDLLGEGESWAWTTAYDQDPWYAVDRSASFDGLTHNVPVVASQTTTPVNGGVIVTQASITVVKGSVKGPETENLPNAGNGSDPYTVNITFTNNGREPLTNLTWEDETLEGPALTDLVCLYQDAEIAEDTVLPVGESVTCTATLPGMPYGEMHRDEFTVNAVGTISGTPVTDDDEWSATTDGVPSWTLAKTSDPASGEVGAGESITYYLMASNTGDLDLDGMVATDDMSSVIWDEQGNRIASMTTDPTVLAARGLTYTEDEASHTATLVWDIPAMRAGAGTSVSFTVTIAEDAFGKTFINNVTGTLPDYEGEEPLEPQQCYPDWFSGEWSTEDNPNGQEPCGTTHTTPKPPVAPTLPPLGGMGQWVSLLVGLGILGGVAVYAYRYESARKARVAARG